ncbi:hypothetical protein CYMTET_26133 [Cymbomonas tetramitiformis]|uniref:Uncharacterized protein n=1 Tax=Cymbomonas tetramitiformis TaxID=36881 RepID=A0AAE0KYC5_9CHLO|nr:hypothetical protein CYMTET_26133 [Cymbomonas tetramitiformis]
MADLAGGPIAGDCAEGGCCREVRCIPQNLALLRATSGPSLMTWSVRGKQAWHSNTLISEAEGGTLWHIDYL